MYVTFTFLAESVRNSFSFSSLVEFTILETSSGCKQSIKNQSDGKFEFLLITNETFSYIGIVWPR